MLTTLGMLAMTLAGGATPEVIGSTVYRPRIELWTNHGEAVYNRGQYVRVYFRVDRDAYVTIFRVDTDGRIRVLFPYDPWEDNFARGGRDFEIDSRGRRAGYRIDDYPGVGYIFGVASAEPFAYDPFVTSDHWDYRVIAHGRMRGDPYVALTELASQIVPPEYQDWDYDLVPYHVERHYDYPRFLCYDCHSYVSWAYWNPYRYSCTSFRIVVYNDPWYYPYRYYRGTRVVFARPYRPEPRYIFKTRSAGEVFVTQARKRPADERGVRGRDIGGVVATPRRRETGDPQLPNRPENTDRRVGRDVIRPDRPESPERPGRTEQPDQPGLADRPERAGRSDQPDLVEHEQGRQPSDRFERPSSPREPDRGSRPREAEPQPATRNESQRADRTRGELPPSSRPAPREDRGRSEPPRPAPREDRGQSEPPRAAPREDRGRSEPPRAAPREDRGRSEPKSAPERREPELKRRK